MKTGSAIFASYTFVGSSDNNGLMILFLVYLDRGYFVYTVTWIFFYLVNTESGIFTRADRAFG